MDKIRKGNDISVEWAIFIDSEGQQAPYDLTGRKLTMYLTNRYGTSQVSDFKTEGNILRWTFYGKDQKHLGNYTLTLVENEGKNYMHTVDVCNAFCLVNHSCETLAGDEDKVKLVYLSISSEISTGYGRIQIDDALSEESENPVQNKVITEALKEKVDKVKGKQLSTEDFTTALKEKLEGLKAFDPTEINNAIKELQDFVNALVNGDATEAIESLNEVLAFLRGIEDTASLEGIVSAILQQIADNKTRIDATAIIVGQLSQKIDILNGTGEGSVINTVSMEIAKLIAEAPDALDTLKEIADFIEADATRAAEILTKLSDHESRIAKIEQEEGFTVMSEAQYEMLPEKEDKLYFLYED